MMQENDDYLLYSLFKKEDSKEFMEDIR